jgi:GNAT superfamily N-acetyltransferase
MEDNITNSSLYDIRYTRLTDISFLKSWLVDPRVIQYFPFNYQQGHDIEFFAKNWINFSRFNAAITAVYDCHPVGLATIYLLPYKKVAHIGLIQIVVDPIWQRKGIGHSLLRNLIHHAKNYFKLEFLNIEFMEGHPMISMLCNLGFYEVFRQEGFYKIEGDYKARIVMEKAL